MSQIDTLPGSVSTTTYQCKKNYYNDYKYNIVEDQKTNKSLAFSFTPKENNIYKNYIQNTRKEKYSRDFSSKVSCLSPVRPKFEVSVKKVIYYYLIFIKFL